MKLPQNLFDGNISVQVFLCQPDKTIIGEILPYGFDSALKFNTYSEISFTIDRYYNDLFEGKTRVHPLYDLIESLRVIYIRGVGHFVIQDVDEGINENESKSVTCFSLEYSTAQKYLENFYVNTGEEGSIETMYHAQKYGAEYSIDKNNTHRKVDVLNEDFDPYQRYYIKKYTDNNDTSWNFVEEQVLDKEDYLKYDGSYNEATLWVTIYTNVRFYWPTCPELSFLHNVFDRIPEWKIGHVDKELWHQERTFSEDRTGVYDFLYNTAADTFDFVMDWDSINGTCSFYKTTEDGVTADEEIETQWDTDVFISRENLASSLDISYSTDDIKTKLKISGSDGLDIRDVNLGQNYIINLSYYNTPLWLGEDLYLKYNAYANKLAEYTAQYKELVSTWSAAYNEYSDLMNYVPVEPRVMLIGDVFEKLYCIKNPYLPAPKEFDDDVVYDIYYKYNPETLEYYEVSTPTAEQLKNGQYYVRSFSSIDELVKQLRTKLNSYDVDKSDNGKMSSTAKTDDVLLTLENIDSNSATVRIRYNQEIKGLGYCKTKVTNDDIINQTKYTLYIDSTSGKIINTTNVKGLTDGDLYVASNHVFEYIGSENAFIATNKPVYLVYRTLTNASTGVSNTLSYTLKEWVNGELLANKMGLDDSNPNYSNTWKIKSIGTLGAYFCLAKDETEKANLEDYGIRLLQEKQDTYTKIFITQTEGYMNEEGSQCVTSNEEPVGDEYPIGTKWLDTNNTNDDGSLIMKIRESTGWVNYTPDDNDYENYARFYENYVKLGNVQSILAEKQLKADYLLNGVAIADRYITKENINSENLLLAASSYFSGQTLILQEYNKEFGYITFIVDSDVENEYAVYVIDNIPYVSYSHSQGLCLTKMNVIKEITDMNNPDNFTEQELVRLSPFIREDEFSDDNFLLTSYESEEEQMYIKQELLKAGEEELKKICQPKLSFNATMANILAIPEFAPIRNQFRLGNFIRIGIREGYVKRARLLEVNINFDDPSDFSATFGDLITTKSEIDKHAELLELAVSAGKSVASNQSKWQKGADKATELDNAINDGLKNAALSIGAADGQSITWDKYGIRGRKLIDGTTDQYHDEQFALINNKLAFTTDNWKTSRAVVGEFEVEIDEQKQKMYGLLADALIGGYIQGTEIRGGNLRIGDGSDNYFQVNEKGNVEIVQAGKEKYASVDSVSVIDTAYKYSVQIVHTGKAVFSSKTDTATMTAKIYRRGVEATDVFKSAGVVVYWEKNPSESNWVPSYVSQNNSYAIILDSEDIKNSAQISCYIDPTEEQIKTIEKNYND